PPVVHCQFGKLVGAVAQILRILRRCFSEIWKTYYCPARLCRISAAPCALGACTKKSWQEDKENPTGARRCFDASQPGKRRRCSRRQKHALAYRWQRSTPKTLPYRFPPLLPCRSPGLG